MDDTDIDTGPGSLGPAHRDSGCTPTLLVGEREHRLYVLDPQTVGYIEAHRNYVMLHAAGAAYIARDSLKRLAGALRGAGFVRIERSLLLNIRAISYAQRVGRGCYAFTLHTGACVRSGPSYRRAILRVLPLAQVPAHPNTRFA